ncbi:MAG: peptidoglycan DD-metalloendopeptidase family protein [Candidatus Gracilibacteria bacterium]
MGSCCKFGWDFNLPGNADRGKPVLATADGYVEEIATGSNGGWGNTVILNHGRGICSRYSHLLDGSIDVEDGQQICQGMKLAEIGNTGFSQGYHLHFQFENCETHAPIEMEFTDGNDVPVCVRGSDRYDNDGNYTALLLTNSMRENCEEMNDFSGEELPANGWRSASCGALSGCPLITNCGRDQTHEFADYVETGTQVRRVVSYLYGECAIDGKADGAFYPRDPITRAEALKIPLYLFGLTRNCGYSEPFDDVDVDDWFFDIVACAVEHGIIEENPSFHPTDEVTFVQAAKLIVMSADEASVIEIQNPSNGHFPEIGRDHWAYRYVETLYSYGALSNSPDSYSPGQTVSRGEYATMVASMSPCFCDNVGCESGCSCNQEMFACVDRSSAPGTGGANPDDGNESVEDEPADYGDPPDPPADDDEPEESPDPVDYDSGFTGLFDIECAPDPSHTECVDPFVSLYIKCEVANNSERDLRINDLVMNLSGDFSDCEITDPNLQSGVGVQTVASAETRELSGHYEVSCDIGFSGEAFHVSFDLKERISGEVTWVYDVARTSIFVESACGAGGGNRPAAADEDHGRLLNKEKKQIYRCKNRPPH